VAGSHHQKHHDSVSSSLLQFKNKRFVFRDDLITVISGKFIASITAESTPAATAFEYSGDLPLRIAM